MPIIVNEDKALKLSLAGITVADAGNPTRPVGVWFGQPDAELREQVYPYITIDFIGYSEDPTRAMRGMTQLTYFPEGANTSEQYVTEYPIPVNLDYQITTFARQPRHDRTDSNGKRLFSNVYTVRISAEVLPREIEVMNEVLTPPNITFNSQPTEFTTL